MIRAFSVIVKIDTSIFGDSEKGIKILVKAERNFDLEYFKEAALIRKIEKLKKEINDLLFQDIPINENYIKLQNLENELKDAQLASKNEYERRYSILVTPIIEKIREKLEEFANLNGYPIILEESKAGFIVSGEIDDLTFEFIKFCNESFEKEKSQ